MQTTRAPQDVQISRINFFFICKLFLDEMFEPLVISWKIIKTQPHCCVDIVSRRSKTKPKTATPKRRRHRPSETQLSSDFIQVPKAIIRRSFYPDRHRMIERFGLKADVERFAGECSSRAVGRSRVMEIVHLRKLSPRKFRPNVSRPRFWLDAVSTQKLPPLEVNFDSN